MGASCLGSAALPFAQSHRSADHPSVWSAHGRCKLRCGTWKAQEQPGKQRSRSHTGLTILALALACVEPLFAAQDATPLARGVSYASVSPTPTPGTAAGPGHLDIPTATATPTPGVVRIDVGAGRGAPSEQINVTAFLHTAGLILAATANDLHFDAALFQLDPSRCRSRAPDHPLLVMPLDTGVVRVLLQPGDGSGRLVDGPLYTCTIAVSYGAAPGTYLLANRNPQAFDVSGAPLGNVAGADGALTVSFLAGTCTGDCNANRFVSVSELVTGVRIALGLSPDLACLPFDRNNDAQVTIDELVEAVRRALGTCFSGRG